MAAAVELDLFGQIEASNSTVEKIAAAIGASQHGTHRLLDAIVAIRYLKKLSEAVGSIRTRPSSWSGGNRFTWGSGAGW